jgi:hypothetical protein
MPIVPDKYVDPKRRWWIRLREFFGRVMINNPISANLCCCCCNPDGYDDLQLLRQRDTAIRREMLLQPRYLGRDNSIQVAMDHARAEQYEMEIDTDPLLPRREVPAQFVPRFAAGVVLAVRERIGQRPPETPGNRELVEREALRLMREYHVKSVDIATHMPSIMRAYFLEHIHYHVATHESRMTRFERWAFRDRNRPQGLFAPVT